MPDKITNEQLYSLLLKIEKQNTGIKEDIDELKKISGSQAAGLEEAKQKIKELTVENESLKKRVEFLDRETRRNNVILFGIKEVDRRLLASHLIDLVSQKLGIGLRLEDINGVTYLGKQQDNKPRPVKLELISNLKKAEIFRNVRKLKGTGISLSDDLAKEERAERKLVYHRFKEAKDQGRSAKLVRGGVIIDDKKYRYGELKGTGGSTKLNPDTQVTDNTERSTQDFSGTAVGGTASRHIHRGANTQALNEFFKSLSSPETARPEESTNHANTAGGKTYIVTRSQRGSK